MAESTQGSRVGGVESVGEAETGSGVMCECGHDKRVHQQHPYDAEWLVCVAEVPEGEGFWGGNVCTCPDFEPAS